MKFIIIIYFILILYIFFYLSKKRTLYIFSPFILVYLGFAINDLIPILGTDREIPNNVIYVANITTIINSIFLLFFIKQLSIPVTINIPATVKKYNAKRKLLIYIFLGLLIIAGLTSGVTIGLLKGMDVENLRAISDIGLGFIKVIPMFGIQFLLLVLFLSKKWDIYKNVAITFLIWGIFLFMITASKSSFLNAANIFLIFFHLKKRGFRWYEYLVYYSIMPIVAGALQSLRGGFGLKAFSEHFYIFITFPLLIFEANTLPIMEKIGENNLYYGESFYYGIVKIIPRFLWPDKPIAFDYELKKLLEYDFDGGGIYTTVSNEFYLNFGEYFWIFYTIWLLLIHYLYKILIRNKYSYNVKILCIFLLLSCTLTFMISTLEVYLLFLLCCLFVYRKKGVV